MRLRLSSCAPSSAFFRKHTFARHNCGVRIVVLVEGESDRIAVETLAPGVGSLEGVDIVAMSGATNVRTFVRGITADVTVIGLCDVAEASLFEQAGIERANCFVCVDDLEDELIRSLGVDAVLGVVEAEGHLRSFRTMQKQPAQRGRAVEAQLRRFIGSHSGFKRRYARQLAEAAIDQGRVPGPLAALIEQIGLIHRI